MTTIPAQFVYSYESKQQQERPANNASYITASTRGDPNFKWQNSGQERRGIKVWVRATKRRITPEYKAFLASEKARREAEFATLTGLLSSLSMSTSETNNKENNYAKSLISGKPSFVRRNETQRAAQQAARLKMEINELAAMMSAAGMEGGKKRRHTKRHVHIKRSKTRRN
jgi:hypothetical protein